MTEDSNKKGFSGLLSLASDIDEMAPRTRRSQDRGKPGGASTKAGETRGAQPAPPPRTKPAPKPRPKPEVVASGSSQGAGKGSSGAKWLLGLFGVGVVLWLFVAAQEDGGKSTGGRSYTPSTPSPSYTPSPPAITQRPALEFSKPPFGQNNVLSVAQIRWCLREDIRIETLRPLTTTNEEVDQFNTIVTNYNSRCSNFQYRQGTLDRARREVEPLRGQIVAGARGMIRWSPSTGPAPTQPRTSQRPQLTIDIQRQLRDLGYNPGPADGIYGPKTKAAIEAFQRNYRLPVDGRPSQALLDRLKRVP